MFLLPGVRGIVVENAHPELIEAVVQVPTFNATRIMADGVLEGLEHFGLIRQAPPFDRPSIAVDHLDPALRRLFTKEALTSLNPDERELIDECYRRALVALRRNITPMGFSACSLCDNEVIGTDINYRSVWARD